MRAFDDLVRAGKVHYIGVSEWKASEIEAALKIADEMGLDRIVSSQPQYSMLWRVIEAEVVPLCEREGIGQIVWSPIAQGVLTGKYLPGQQPPEGSRATDANGGDKMISRWMRDEVLEKVQQLGRWPSRPACRRPSWPSPGCWPTRTSRRPSSARRGPSRCATTWSPPGRSSRPT
jgi:aryl-alcohol dehydrogenase-like predicted oxidoreductase